MSGKRKKEPIDPETLERWAHQRREFEAWLAGIERELELRRVRREHRAARLRRVTFGLLGRRPSQV
ncbi:MAG: hypothetical protein ACRC50_07765 [Gaiella sp.]